MSKAHAEFTVLKSKAFRDEYPHKDLLDSLEAALKPVKVEPGTVEADIEALVEACPQFDNDGGPRGFGPPPPAHMALLKRGFDAVPALIRYATDIRLCRAASQAFMKLPPKIFLLGQLVARLLDAIGGPELEWGWLMSDNERTTETKKLEEWWAKAREEGEEKYLRRNLMKEQRHLNNDTLTLVATRYPAIILEKFEAQLKQGADAGNIIDAVSRSSMSRDAKLSVFREGTRSKDLAGREAALRALKPLDERAFLAELIKTLDSFGESADAEFLMMAPETRYPYLLLLTDDQKAWDALARAAKRAEVGLRMEYLRHLAHGGARTFHASNGWVCWRRSWTTRRSMTMRAPTRVCRARSSSGRSSRCVTLPPRLQRTRLKSRSGRKMTGTRRNGRPSGPRFVRPSRMKGLNRPGRNNATGGTQ